MKMTINLESVTLGETENHLVFKGDVPRKDNFRKYKFDFTGVELTSTSGLTEEQLERLCEQLSADYGTAPFDITVAQRTLGNGKQYRIEM